MAHPEHAFSVGVTAEGKIIGHRSGEPYQSICIADLTSVHVETADSGPWGMDVWWILRDATGGALAFPQGAIGEEAVLARLERLPGFQVRGMNSIGEARFLCWPLPDA